MELADTLSNFEWSLKYNKYSAKDEHERIDNKIKQIWNTYDKDVSVEQFLYTNKNKILNLFDIAVKDYDNWIVKYYINNNPSVYVMYIVNIYSKEHRFENGSYIL